MNKTIKLRVARNSVRLFERLNVNNKLRRVCDEVYLRSDGDFQITFPENSYLAIEKMTVCIERAASERTVQYIL